MSAASAASVVNDSNVIVGRAGNRVEVVVQPDRLEAEPVGLLGDLDGPHASRVSQPSYSLSGLGNDGTDLHRGILASGAGIRRRP